MGMKEKLRKIWSISADKIKTPLNLFFKNQVNSNLNSTHHCDRWLWHIFFFLFKLERQQKTLAGIFYFEMQRSRNSLWEDPVYKFLRSKVVFNFKISSSLLGHYFSTLVLWFASMCVQILDQIRQPWGLGILLRAEFRAHNGVKFLIK